ncbi:MAG: hypothetical protein AB1473_14375 [Thermodesulfobacteriota bacterium]
MALKGKILEWKDCSPVQFVRRWETLAQGPSAFLYGSHPGTGSLTRANLNKLHALWCNRAKPNSEDRNSASKLARCLPQLNAFQSIGQPKENDVLAFYDELTRVVGRRFSLKIFALHAALPRVFPPFCHRRLAAFRLLTGEDPLRRFAFTEALLTTYFVYQKFFFDLSGASAADISRVDRSLLAVGLFIKSYHSATLT